LFCIPGFDRCLSMPTVLALVLFMHIKDSADPDTAQSYPLICLEDGLDQASCDYLQVNENGLVFESPWLFEPMKRIAIQMHWPESEKKNERVSCESVVVHSHPCGARRYQTTLLFSDTIN